MKNFALFLFLTLLASACTKGSLTDSDENINKLAEEQIREDMLLLKNSLRDYNVTLGLEGLRSLQHKTDLKKLLSSTDLQAIVKQQSRLASQLRQLPGWSRSVKIAELSPKEGGAKSFGDWGPFYHNCNYDLQLNRHQLRLEYYECLAGAQDEAEEQSCLLSYLKKNAGITLENYACTHTVTF